MTLVTAAAGLLVSSMWLAGCGSSPEAQRPPGVRESIASPRDDRPVIAAFGDSLTEGHGVEAAKSYPEALQRELDRRGYHYRVANLGVSGDTSTDGLARLDGVLALDPRFVILEFGANDGLRGLPVAGTKANLERMTTALEQVRAGVILAGMTLPPNYGPEYIHAFEAMYQDLAAKYRLAFIPFLLEGVAGNTMYMQDDGLHPNAAGYARVAGTVLGALEPRLKTAPIR
jgi:acyl-CoA thioesterase-1